jgi:eukaryotic-like serine/threonine-protein kinase
LKLSTRSLTDLLTHIGIVLALLAVLFLGFFFIYLPFATHHAQTITVPDLTRLSTDELRTLLEDRDLRYEVSDCTFVAGAEPLAVMAQYPRSGAKVKQGRKIYVTLNRRSAPMIAMPKLTDMTYRSAELALRSAGLQIGQPIYVPDRAKNSVLRQLFQGRDITPGTPIAKGSVIDVEVGNGLGNTRMDMPDVVNMPLDEAKILLKGSNLQVGVTVPVDDPEQEVGTVIRQKPRAGESIRVGETVDLWVVGPLEEPQ